METVEWQFRAQGGSGSVADDPQRANEAARKGKPRPETGVGSRDHDAGDERTDRPEDDTNDLEEMRERTRRRGDQSHTSSRK